MKPVIEQHCSVIKNRVSTGDACLYMLEGSSMRPAFREGDILLMKKVPLGSLKPGNVIVFDSPIGQKTIIHRITGFREDGTERFVITQGDRSSRPDKPVRQKFIKGLVSAQLINGKFRPCRRYQEIFQLFSSRVRRSFRRFIRYLAVQLTQIILLVLPTRVRPLFAGTRLNDRFRV